MALLRIGVTAPSLAVPGHAKTGGMAKRAFNRSGSGQKPPQGRKLRRASLLRYVRIPEFRAGLADRAADKPPGPFNSWSYEHGRSVADAILANGADPLAATDRALAGWLMQLLLDGTIVP